MKTSDFDYYLPPECIAQTPVEPRHAARLLVLHRDSSALEHTTFWQVGDYLRPGDVLVVNQTRVIPARLFGRKPTGGRVEVLLLKQEDECTWKALVGGKRLVSSKKLTFDNDLSAEIVAELRGSGRLVRFSEPVQPHLQR
ncbi:MAG: S-adenosylmethionine:tRNA ribosyltransferase-isomerase, partial [Chloroflexi bacterium]|nr:S-adenosylmethionine:tRNA ribosyltransferase-isomerase [Chloroflexota bacterium]